MTTMMTTTTFDTPGPGYWQLDRSHYGGGTTLISQWLMTNGCRIGMDRMFKAMGVPARYLDAQFVHGFMYTRLVPLVDGKPGAKLPPAPVLRAVTRLHPEFRRRTSAARTCLSERPWRAVIADWNANRRPALRARNAELSAVDVGALDDQALASHLDRCLEHALECFALHFDLHGYDLGPLGLLLVDARRWGIDASEIIVALGGASPSTAAPARQLADLRRAVTATGTRPASLDELRALSPQIATLVDAYLDDRGYLVVTGYDVTAQTLAELPDTFLSTILDGNEAADEGAHDVSGATAKLRERVPETERALFDERLAEARAALDLRDDNGPNTAQWPVGIVRMALLEAGRRLAATGRLEAAAHVFELDRDEVVALVRTGTGPSADELAQRAARRRADAALVPPDSLGAIEPAPPLAVLPGPLATMIGVVNAVLDELGMTVDETRASMMGIGVGAATYQGRACMATDADDAITRLEPGDVLVVRFTSPSFNVVLPLAGAIVTAEGGPLSHAAVLARELGLPAVVGVKDVLTVVHDGDQVEVDPASGRVRVVA